MSNYFLETQWHEWILTAKNGSYALGTGNLINQRKYNGLLVKSDNEFQRYLLVSSIEEEAEMNGENFFMDSAHYQNCVFPEGFLHLVKSWLRPYPVFLYSALPHNDDILIKKEVMMDEDSATVMIKYTNLSLHKLHFRLRPKYALRNHHYLNQSGTFDYTRVSSEVKSINDLSNIVFSVQRSDNQLTCFGWMQHGFAYQDFNIYRDVFFPWEASRGYPATEDLVAPIGLEFDLKPNESNYLIFSEQDYDDYLSVVDRIEKKYKKLPSPDDIPKGKRNLEKEETILPKLDYDDNIMFSYEDYMKILEFSMKDFLANNDIIAGFPWFGCWGRDTMISMEGIQKLPKGAKIAHDILMKYAAQIKNGLIPNMCSESHQQANYLSMDATLWFIIRLYETCKDLSDNYAESKKSKITRWKEAIKITEDTLESILEKPHSDFFIRHDGLLELREHFASATWMDAKVNGYAVTPRSGAPVEINALFYNCLCCYEKMIENYNAISPDRDNMLTNQIYLEARSCIQSAFQKYWIGDFLADRIVNESTINEYRPNAVIAMSLPFSQELLSQDKLQQVYETAHVELFTPYGLRTLSPRDPKFQKKYIGGVEERDNAYHQGTVWAWPMLAFAKTWLKAFPSKSKEELVKHTEYLIQNLRNGYMRGHIASVAEVWDGDKPHFPKGCPAQAWSVSALYSIEKLIEEIKK